MNARSEKNRNYPLKRTSIKLADACLKLKWQETEKLFFVINDSS